MHTTSKKRRAPALLAAATLALGLALAGGVAVSAPTAEGTTTDQAAGRCIWRPPFEGGPRICHWVPWR